MKTHSIKYTILLAGLAAVTWSWTSSYKKTSGAHPGSTGAPNELTCAQSGCHSDASVNDGTGVNTITFGNNETVYEPGKTYTVKVKVQKAGIEKFGFQIVALLDKTKGNAGQFSITNSSRTQLQSDVTRKYVTHTSAGTPATATGETEWQFSWKAPATDQGRVNFYVATNCTNGDNTNQNDAIYLSKLMIHSPATTSITEPEDGIEEVKISPNPLKEKITIEYNRTTGCFTTISLMSLEGKTIKILYKGMQSSGPIQETFLMPQNLAPGAYIVSIASADQSVTKKILVK